MSLLRFAEGIRFNFPNFLAFCLLTCCFITWWKILDGDFHDSAHVSEIRTGTLALTMLVVGYYFGASQNSKKKDDTIQQMLQQSGTKDEVIKNMTQDAKDLVNNPIPGAPVIPAKVDVTIKEDKQNGDLET